MGVVGDLEQARERLVADRAAEARRQSRVLRSYLIASIVGSVFYAVYYARHGVPDVLIWVTVGLALSQAVALGIALSGREYLAGVLAQVLPILPVLFIGSALSVEAGFGSILFIGALGVMVTIPENRNRTRLTVVGCLVAAIIVMQAVFTRQRAWAPLPPADTAQLSTINRTVMTIALFALALLLTRSIRVGQRLVEQTIAIAEAVATTDPLTGLANRRPVWERLETPSDRDVTVALIDVDHFKQLNDAHGHDCGDEALVHVARVLRDTVRSDDIVGRWGGEEFVVVLSAPLELARVIIERAREAIAATPAECDAGAHPLTVSAGIALLHDGAADEALKDADGALYRAKQGGRNRVELAS